MPLSMTRAITGALSADGRPQTHPAIATIDVSTMLNRPKASHRISTSKRFLDEHTQFLDESGYTSGYARRKQEALSQWERASDLLLRGSGGRI